MSGLEAVGIAASILQIADVGMKVSINLCQLYSKVRRADSSLQTLSSEIALTCNVLHQLGELLKQDVQGSLCSQQALATAQDVLGECRRVFGEIENATERCKQNADDERDKERFLGKTFRRMTFVFKEPDLEALRKNLDRLKSTMLLMLNVIMYAGQVRSNTNSFMLNEQRDLIASLIETKTASEAEVKVLSSIINSSKSAATAAAATTTTEVIPRDLGDSPSSCSSDDPLSFKSSLSYEMWIYCGLIREMLSQVDGCESELEENRYERIRERVWRLHMREAERFPEEIPEEIQQVFGDIFPLDRDLEEKFTRKKARQGNPNPKLRELHRDFSPPDPRFRTIDQRGVGRPRGKIRPVSETENLVLQWTTLDKNEFEDSIISWRRLPVIVDPPRSEESD